MAGPLHEHFQAYPLMQPQDAVKLLYQRHFGAGHALADPAGCLLLLQQEYAQTPQTSAPLLEDLGGGMCRVSLSALDAHGISPAALSRLFVEGAREPAAVQSGFEESLAALLGLAEAGAAPFSGDACRAYLQAYAAQGYPAVSHSGAYRTAYRPAYRVLPQRLAKFLPLCSALEAALQAGIPQVLGVDGRCGSGKTSLANLLQKLYDCAIIRMDDFYLPQDLRSPQRLQAPGGNIHYERFYAEVSLPLSRGEAPRYRRYACASGSYGAAQAVQPGSLLVVEGSYSLHPQCALPCTQRVFLTVSEAQQRERLRQREQSGSYTRFLSQWIPMEEAYFASFHIAESCAYLIDTSS